MPKLGSLTTERTGTNSGSLAAANSDIDEAAIGEFDIIWSDPSFTGQVEVFNL